MILDNRARSGLRSKLIAPPFVRAFGWLHSLLAIVVLIHPSIGSAQTKSWNVNGGSFHTSGNWTPSGVPGSSNYVWLYLQNSGTITFSSNVSTGILDVSANSSSYLASATLDLNGKRWTVPTFMVGDQSFSDTRGSLMVRDGTLAGTSTEEFSQVNPESSLTIESGGIVDVAYLYADPDSTINVNTGGKLLVYGFYREGGTLNLNDGTLEIDAGYYSQPTGPLVLNGSTASANPTLELVNGASTSGIAELRVGDSRNGTVQISSGSALSNSGEAYIGQDAGSTGSITIGGTGALWTSHDRTRIGSAGTGTLTVNAGGLADLRDHVYLGGTAASVINAILVTGSNARMVVDGTLVAGLSGDGTMTIEAGGMVENEHAQIAFNSTSDATVNVGGGTGTLTSLWTNSDSLSIGGSTTTAGGRGTLNITARGLVEVGTTTKLWNDGTLTVDGGTLQTTNFDRSLGRVNHYDGTIKVNGGAYTQTAFPLIIAGNALGKNPILQLVGNGTTTGIEGVVVGRTGNSENGQLAIESGRVFNNLGNGTLIGTVDGTAIYRGHTYFGLNPGSLGTASVAGSGSQFFSRYSLFAGYQGNANVTISDGGQVVSNLDSLFGANTYVAYKGTSVANFNVTGHGSNLSTRGLYAGYEGNAAINVLDGASINSSHVSIADQPGSAGSITVNGVNETTDARSTLNGSGLLQIGASGHGVLNVLDGGSVVNTGAALGIASGALGEAVVNGPGSQWTSYGPLSVGHSGAGYLTITNSGRVDNYQNGVIGQYDSGSQYDIGSALVSGQGSTWINYANLTVGDQGDGYLNVTNSGYVYSGYSGFVGLNGGGYGRATIDGGGSLWANVADLTVGYVGTGEMYVTNGAEVSNNYSGNIGLETGSFGYVQVSGEHSEWNSYGGLTVAGSGTGYLTIDNGGQVLTYGTTTVGAAGTLTLASYGTLTTTSFARAAGGTVNFHGGELMVNGGSYVQPTGPLTIHSGSLRLNGTGFTSGIGAVTINRSADPLEPTGQLTLTDGRDLVSSDVTIHGYAQAYRSGTTWNAASLHLSADGVLALSNQAVMTVSGATELNGEIDLGAKLATNSMSGNGVIYVFDNAAELELTGSGVSSVGSVQSFPMSTGSFVKSGQGTLQVGHFDVDGPTVITGGELRTNHPLPEAGDRRYYLGATDATLADNPVLSQYVPPSSFPLSLAGIGATSLGSLDTSATILFGENTSGEDFYLSMQFRQRTADEMGVTGTSPPLPFAGHGGLISDVLSLTGMVNNPGIDPHQTDLFVLQMSYDESLLNGLEAALAANRALYLAYFDETSGKWTNAAGGNVGSTANLFMGDMPWNSGFTTLGQWGVDTNANTVWAVLDHNSLFAAVPEPCSFGLAAVGLAGLLALRRRHRCVTG